MEDFSASSEFVENLRIGAFVAWLITILLAAAGFQRIKEIVAFILTKLYEFLIQKNAVKL